MVFWELLIYDEDEKGGLYRIIETAETSDLDPKIPKFKKEKELTHAIILRHKNTGVEAYLLEDV